MSRTLEFDIGRQPDDTTCGPTCLHAVYRYHGDDLPLEAVIQQAARLEEGGTLGVMLGCHALERGYRATLTTYNLEAFDPTWFAGGSERLSERLQAQLALKQEPKLAIASQAYLRFLELGGTIRMADLTPALLRRSLKKQLPVLTGLSATFLYQCARENPRTNTEDDLGGHPQGHFVVLCGYVPERREVIVADPYFPNPVSTSHTYPVPIGRAITAILLGVLTYDANLLVIEPQREKGGTRRAHAP